MDEVKIFVETFNDIDITVFDSRQIFTYNCRNCGRLAEKKLYRLQQANFELLCRGCSKRKNTKPLTEDQKLSAKLKREQTNLEKFGTKNPLSCKEIREKIKETNLERYGEESFSKTNNFKQTVKKTWSEKSEEALDEIKAKSKVTCIEKYGVEFATQSEEIKKTIKQTNLERYGTEYHQQSEQGKKIRQETLLKNFGVDNPSRSKELQEKKKATNLSKYGVEWSIASESVKQKAKETCKERYGTESFSQTDEFKQKTKATWQKKLQADNPQKNEQVRLKTKQTCLERYGVENFSQSKDMQQFRRSRYIYDDTLFDSKPELAYWIYCKDNGIQIERNSKGLEYKFAGKVHKYFPDFVVNSELVEVKGDQFLKEDGSWQNPFDVDQNAVYEAKGNCAKENNVKIIRSTECQPYIDYVESKYTKDYMNLFRQDLPFPYLNSDLKETTDFALIQHFHKSIYEATKLNKLSPLAAWQDKQLIRKVAINRLRYVGHCKPSDILQGFSVMRIAPKISVFRPRLATELIQEYLNDFENIVDPFSGFSGRLLGAFNCGKSYFGKDINTDHVRESNEILEFKKMDTSKYKVEVENLLTKSDIEFYDCLFTCPPYGGKEHWNKNNDEIEKTCDEWIDICLQKYKCSRYVFVVDVTEKYKDFVKRSLVPKNGLFKKNTEVVVVLDQKDLQSN